MQKASLYETSKIMRRAGNVTRFHTHRMVFPDKVGTHSFNIAIMAYHIAQVYNTTAVEKVDAQKCATYMLLHDVAEHIVGDVPGHIKAGRKDLKMAFDTLESEWMTDTLDDHLNLDTNPALILNEYEALICNFCDKFESLQTCFEELRLSNFSFKYVFNRINEHVHGMIIKVFSVDYELAMIMHGIYSEFVHDVGEKFNGRYKIEDGILCII